MMAIIPGKKMVAKKDELKSNRKHLTIRFSRENRLIKLTDNMNP